MLNTKTKSIQVSSMAESLKMLQKKKAFVSVLVFISILIMSVIWLDITKETYKLKIKEMIKSQQNPFND